MPEGARAQYVCDRAHASDLVANFSFIKVVSPSFRPVSR
jgi:hypothetical protein